MRPATTVFVDCFAGGGSAGRCLMGADWPALEGMPAQTSGGHTQQAKCHLGDEVPAASVFLEVGHASRLFTAL